MNIIRDRLFDKSEKRSPLDEDGHKVLILNGTVNENMYETFMHMYAQCEVDDRLIVELTTKGGEVTWAYMISQILQRHVGSVVVRVPRFAMSAGTIIALSSNKIVLSSCGCLGPIDPYIFGLNVPTSTSVLKEYNSRVESWCNTLTSLMTFKWINWGVVNVITNYCERMLGKINDDHNLMIKKLLKTHGSIKNVDDVYDFFTHTSHHGTPIYFNDIPTELNLDIEEDLDLLKKIYDRDNPKMKPDYPPKSNPTYVDSAIDMYAGLAKEYFNKTQQPPAQPAPRQIPFSLGSNTNIAKPDFSSLSSSPLSFDEKPDKPDKPDKRDKPDKPDKPDDLNLHETADSLISEVVDSVFSDNCKPETGVEFNEEEGGLVEE